MCKHILNAQVAIRSACCRKWFDCAECHQEQESHQLAKSSEMIFACKKCKKCFRKDASEFEERFAYPARSSTYIKLIYSSSSFSDEYCPHCDNHFVLEAVTPQASLQVEGDDARMDNRMLKDDRVRGDTDRSLFKFRDVSDRMG
ncbi:uncharacterized protein N7469_011012 [Penicillium citrinum]|uniref:CHY-type domain-containing protein n=2 Tax=Penicillium TaxID=5073 RepID=A0A9W9TI37_PENCI|nr:uncharacterized protein N7469_011012 [Penicillium citrinum]KAJ5222125.1 hypothetical protein N7469_011012 [Penicillium citrinum]KAJ5597101.1 hypothetical protein N7450_003559 [Penicillium hetheringtonii]KAK5797382.1 hypothetical protein VI817_003673 [Penicillium citrinum]